MSNLAIMEQQKSLQASDPAAVAAAEAVKARIQSAYQMAIFRPRSEAGARQKILDACKNKTFAEAAEYSKPVGGSAIKGPSIRFAELALREWGNVIVETQMLYEDMATRRVKVSVLDLETNASFGRDITISKTVERANASGREVVGQRTNTSGKAVYIVKATDDAIANKESAQISKVVRNEGLRLIPADIVEEAMDEVHRTLKSATSKDLKTERKKVADAFLTLGVPVDEIESYLGRSIERATDDDIVNLRSVYNTIKSGESKWADYMYQAEKEQKAEQRAINLEESQNAIKDAVGKLKENNA